MGGERSNDPVKRFVSHNCRGLNDKQKDRIEAWVEWGRTKKVHAACLQETWRAGGGEETNQGWMLIHHGLKEPVCKRGSQGVAVLLSPEAKVAWEKAGGEISRFGDRILAVRLQTKDGAGRKRIVYLVSAYAPVSSDTAGRAKFKKHLQECLDECRRGEWLLLGMDANAALGRRRSSHDRVLGPHGLERTNEAGDDLYQFLAQNELCVPSTFFRDVSKSGMARYATWWHPNLRSNNRAFQNDHFIMQQRDLKRVA